MAFLLCLRIEKKMKNNQNPAEDLMQKTNSILNIEEEKCDVPEKDENKELIVSQKTIMGEKTEGLQSTETQKKTKRKKFALLFILLQVGIVFSSLSGVCAKFASNYSFMSWQFIVIYIGEILLLGIYAIIWQQVIKRMQLSISGQLPRDLHDARPA